MSQTKKGLGQMQLHLSPQQGDAFTRWRLTGSTVTAIPHRELRRLFRTLSFWSGWPVELVLPVDVQTAAWFECWTEAIDATPADHLTVRFDVREPSPWPTE